MAAQTPRPAATLALLRDAPGGPEVLMLQRTKDAGQLEGTDLRSIVGTWSSALNDRSNLALSLRHTTSEGRNAYDESAVIGTLSMRF